VTPGGHRKATDHNQAEIVAALRDAGHQVVTMHGVGGGFPDLIVARGGQVWLVEVKARGGRLTPAQVDFFERWSGPPIRIVRTVDEALEAVGVAT